MVADGNVDRIVGCAGAGSACVGVAGVTNVGADVGASEQETDIAHSGAGPTRGEEAVAGSVDAAPTGVVD